MDEQELKEYLSEHLKIEFFSYRSCDDRFLGVKLLLDGEEISRDESFVKYW